jgi:hypothetical protein
MLEKIEALGQWIQKSKSVTKVKFEPSWEGLDSVFISIQRNHGVVANAHLTSLLLESDGFELFWSYKPTEDLEFQSETIPGGEINVPSVTRIYSLPTKDKLWFDDMDKQGTQGPSYKAFCQQLRILENLLESTESVFIVMSPEWLGKKLSYADPKILFWNTTGAKYLLSLTLENYFEACIEAKAFSGWQCFYIDEEGMNAGHPFVTEYLVSNFNEAKTKRERFLREMPRLFPEMDFSKFSELHSKLS